MEKKKMTIAGLTPPLYLLVFGILVICMYTHCVPSGLVGGMFVLMVLGEGLNTIGKTLPVVKVYLGGSVICILGAAVIRAVGLIPEDTIVIVDDLVNKQGFLVFYISALICGSLFNIDRDLLLRATVRILPTSVISLAVGITVIGLMGMLQGFGFLESILYIAIPMTSGGMTFITAPLRPA